MKNGFRICIAIMALTGLTACLPSEEHNHPQLTSRDALYEFHCGECHGKDGLGGTVDQATANLMRRISYNEMMEYVINDVNPERQMPVFDSMTRGEAQMIIDYVLVLRKQAAGGVPGQW